MEPVTGTRVGWMNPEKLYVTQTLRAYGIPTIAEAMQEIAGLTHSYGEPIQVELWRLRDDSYDATLIFAVEDAEHGS